jgi:hypothetical protein
MEFGYVIWNGLMVSALFWFGWRNLFMAEQSRDELRRIFKGIATPTELPLLATRIVGAVMLILAMASFAGLMFAMLQQSAS